MKILDLFPNPEILEDNTYWTNRVRFSRPAHVPGATYSFVVAKSRPSAAKPGYFGADGPKWACSCREWLRKRDCKHIRFIEGRSNA